MNAQDADPLPPEVPAVDAGGDAVADKPRRRRPPRKLAAAADAPAAESVSQGEPAPAAPLELPAAAPVPRSHDAAAEGVSEAGRDEPAPAPNADPAGDDKPAGARRGRNRRRGRRGGDRAREARPEGEGEGQGEGQGEGETLDGTALAAQPKLPAPDVGEVFAKVMSGEFDAETPALADDVPALAEEAPPPKRVLAADPDAPKLHKVLAQAGVGSRRDLEQMIVENRVTVNGEVAHTGQRISFGDRIAIDGKPVRYRIAPPPPRVLAYHKPAGEVVTHDDPQQRPTVFRRLPRLAQGKWQSVGRLDINTEGLLLFTNSGELANQLMHPRFGVEREYAVRSLGVLAQEAKARLLEGVEIEGQRCGFKSIEDGGGEGVNHWYRVVITEGRNREVRKLFEAVGHAVSRLIRIRYGSVVLPRGLKRGVWVDLDDADLRNLRRLASAPRPEGAREAREPREGDPGPRRGRNRRGGKRRPEDMDRPPRSERADTPYAEPREPRPPRPPREPRPPRPDAGEGGAIPNPLQQTFDKRAIQQERALRRDMPEDGPIPNPLQQTYDKRALQRDRQPQREIPEDGPIPNPLQQTYDKRFAHGSGTGNGAGGGARGRARGPGPGQPRKGGTSGANRPPDPMQTSVGYIGADALRRKSGGRGGARRPGGGGGAGGPGRGGSRGGGRGGAGR